MANINKKRDDICVDFDRTISVRNSGDNIFKFGEPIVPMIELIKKVQAKGFKIKVLTARPESQWDKIKTWMEKQGINVSEVGNIKNSRLALLLDDKAIGVIENEGITHYELLLEAKNMLLNSISGGKINEETLNKWLQSVNQMQGFFSEVIE
jgi:hypothetical protein